MECFSYHPLLSPPSPLQSFPLFPLEWHFQLSESTPTPPPRDLLSSFILISLFRQIGSAKWGNYENGALMNCEKSFFAPAPPPYRGRRGGSSTFSATIFAGDTLFRPHEPRSYVSQASSGRIPFRLLVCRLLPDADAAAPSDGRSLSQAWERKV